MPFRLPRRHRPTPTAPARGVTPEDYRTLLDRCTPDDLLTAWVEVAEPVGTPPPTGWQCDDYLAGNQDRLDLLIADAREKASRLLAEILPPGPTAAELRAGYSRMRIVPPDGSDAPDLYLHGYRGRLVAIESTPMVGIEGETRMVNGARRTVNRLVMSWYWHPCVVSMSAPTTPEAPIPFPGA